MSVVTEVADAVVAELNAQEFSLAFTAVRSYLPRYDLAEMKDLRVTVVPRSMAILPATRSQNQHDVEIDIAVQKKLTKADNQEIDSLVDLVDEIAQKFRLKRLSTLPAAVWAKTVEDPIYLPEHLDQLRQFTSVVTLTFRLAR